MRCDIATMKTFTNLISVPELKSTMESGRCRIVDCRFNLMQPDDGRQEYIEAHIPGATYAHLDDDLAGPIDPGSGRHPLPELENFVRALGHWGIDNDTQVIAYDHANGSVAARLWWMLRWLGHSKIAVLDGGISAWIAAGQRLEKEVPKISRVTFSPSPDESMIATTEEIADAVAKGEVINLVDARDATRFSGEIEPVDAIAGHIPGAMNLPFQSGVNFDGTWRSADDHRRAWANLLADRPDKPVIAMCGSGVTACHLLISARLSGRPEPRLYVGSWSEWIRDARRPLATGK
jgi:thiosulfate/3-mercaptopyruvate sulfurtransferase